ncbi:MAG: carbon-nitrogen family hydrolase [Promethearchaeota archaeon]
MDIVLGDKEANLKSVIQVIHEAKRLQADILVLPELFTTGYFLEKASELAEKQDGYSINLLRDLASRFHIFLVAGSLLERRGKQIYNTCRLIGKDGRIVGSYDKIHLFPPFSEDKYLTPGTTLPIFKTDLGVLGVAICFDIRFPELTRSLVLRGAQVIFVPAEFPAERISIWATLLRARAIENQVFVVGCNRVGSDGNHSFGGRSAIIDPEGKALAQAGGSQQIVSAVIDLDRITYVRERLPTLKFRREALYRT